MWGDNFWCVFRCSDFRYVYYFSFAPAPQQHSHITTNPNLSKHGILHVRISVDEYVADVQNSEKMCGKKRIRKEYQIHEAYKSIKTTAANFADLPYICTSCFHDDVYNSIYKKICGLYLPTLLIIIIIMH